MNGDGSHRRISGRPTLTSAFRITMPDALTADGVRVDTADQLPAALAALGLHQPSPTVVVVGGAGGLDDAGLEQLRALFVSGIVPVMAKHGAIGVDGGTRFGVMRLFGEARAASGASFPLVGVVAAGTVKLPGLPVRRDDQAELEPNHTHFLVVPGDEWGAESPWIARTATQLAGIRPSVTVLINGGQIAYSDVERSVQAGRQVVVVAGTGRTADEVAAALTGSSGDARAAALVASGLLASVPHGDTAGLVTLLDAALSESPPPQDD